MAIPLEPFRHQACTSLPALSGIYCAFDMSIRSDSGEDSSAALALGSIDISAVEPDKEVKSAHSRTLLGSRAQQIPFAEVRDDKDVVESEQMGFRLAREISHLRERLSRWKQQCGSLEARLEASLVDKRSLQDRLTDADGQLQGAHNEIEKLRVSLAIADNDKDELGKKMHTMILEHAECLRKKDSNLQQLSSELSAVKREVYLCILRKYWLTITFN